MAYTNQLHAGSIRLTDAQYADAIIAACLSFDITIASSGDLQFNTG